MLRTRFPQEAIGQAHHLVAAYGQAQVGLARIAAEFRESLRPVIRGLGPEASPYLRNVREDLDAQLDRVSHAEPLFHDEVSDWMHDRVITASHALIGAIDDEARCHGIAL